MPNPYILAADNSPELLPLLRERPELASAQDDHGYSLIHAAASYNFIDLLRRLVLEFHVDVNLRDEDNETALFVAETVDVATVLVEDLGADIAAKNADGLTARQKIEEDGEAPQVAEYLKTAEARRTARLPNGITDHGPDSELPAPPEGMTVSVGTITAAEENDAEVDPEFRRRIEQLAERDDFHTDAGQAELRQLVQDAVADGDLAERNVRPRRN